MKQNMITGSPAKSLFLFALPMVAGNLFQQLYNIIDSIVVGNYIGADALGAVGASTPIVMLFVAMATGMSIGCSVLISQFLGAGKKEEMKTAIFTAFISVTVLGVLFLFCGQILTDPLLYLLKTPKDIFSDAKSYLSIYFWGMGFLFCYNGLNAVFNGLGMSYIPLVFLICSSVLNVVLDLVFVKQYPMGIEGVAWATFIAQGISALVSFLWLLLTLKKMERKEEKVEEERKKRIYFDKDMLKDMCRIAIPSSIQQSIVSIGFLFVQALVNSYGTVIVAGYTAATKIDNIAILPMANVGNAVSTFTAQNMGARKPERISRGYGAAIAMVACIGIVILLLLYLWGDVFIGAFVDSKTQKKVIDVGVDYLRTVSVWYMLMGFMNVTNGVLRGSGDIRLFMVTTLANFSVRVMMAHVLTKTPLEARGIWWSIPIGWGVGFIIARIRYRTGKWKEITLI